MVKEAIPVSDSSVPEKEIQSSNGDTIIQVDYDKLTVKLYCRNFKCGGKRKRRRLFSSK